MSSTSPEKMDILSDCSGRARRCLLFLINNVKAFLVRFLFAIHGIITVWRITDVYEERIYYLLCIPIVLLFVEVAVTTYCTENGEWKWVCPSVLLYLASVVPGIWLLQYDLYRSKERYREEHGLSECGQLVYNSTGLRSIGNLPTVPIALSSDQWALALEQILFFILIMGRWLLPKGPLTRDQLSQLLLVYVGIAADSLEFSLETLKMPQVVCNVPMIFIILSIWTWSLVQFSLVLTSVSAPKPRMAHTERARSILGGCWENEIWAILITMFLQDAPYLIMRLYLMIAFQAINQLMLFFTIKNTVLVCLQLYRMAILCCTPKEQITPIGIADEEVGYQKPHSSEAQLNSVAMDVLTTDEEDKKNTDDNDN